MNKDENELYFLVDGALIDFEDVPLLKLNKSNKALLDWLIELGYFADSVRLIAFTDFKAKEF